MRQTTVDTFWANIFVGRKNTKTGMIHHIDKARELCSDYVNSVGLCVTFTPTEYIYSDSDKEDTGEPGFVVGLINYPRFPSEPHIIRRRTMELARILKKAMEQHRVTVMFSDITIMLGEH